MKYCVILICVGSLIFSCGSSEGVPGNRDRKEQNVATNWYDGGTLHDATVRKWKKATEKNKLATCGDFMAIVDESVSIEELKTRAINVRACINEATRGVDAINNEKVITIAAMCAMELGY